MPAPQMIIGTSPQDLQETPNSIIYSQMKNVLADYSGGRDYSKSMTGLMAIMDADKDTTYHQDMDAVRVLKVPHDIFWATFTAIVRLLKRKHLWTEPPEAINVGEEFAQGF